jgi:LacI family transcriptional regulator
LIKFDQDQKMPRVTLAKVARLAKVGTATVERVLNGRGGVRPETVERVLAAARKLDYPKRLPERHRGVTRIEVLMLRPELSFIKRLSKAFERIAASLDPSISVHRTFMDESDAHAIARRILNPGLHRSALLVALPQHPAIRDALAEVQRKGLPVVQVMTHTDDPGLAYVGIDNQAAGRMAGLLMAGMQPKTGQVMALCHSQIYGVHRDRLRGFSEFMAKPQACHLSFTAAHFMHDSEQEIARVATEALRRNPDIVGLYCAGGDYGELCDQLRRNRKQHSICLIGHELTEQSAAALKDGTMSAVIDQAPETQARRALDLVLHKLGLLESEVDSAPIRFITVTAENL